MNKKVLVVAPHPDDETLGCGGTLLKHLACGDEIHWLIMTSMSVGAGYAIEKVERREKEIAVVGKAFEMKTIIQLHLKPAGIDNIPKADLVQLVSDVIYNIKPEILYIPYADDVHSDHKLTSDAILAASKSFRSPFIKRVLAYETISETDYNISPSSEAFRPNVWVDVSSHIKNKVAIMKNYVSELDTFPFPRSELAILSQASLRGSQCNAEAGEAFMLLKEIC